MSDITVFTSITGGKDHLRENQVTDGAKFIAYVSERQGSKVWEEREAYNRFRSDRRNARAPKILSHHYCDTPYSLWLDGNIALREKPARIVEEWLVDHDFAVFKHPDRDCLYEESTFCAERELDDPKVIIAQAAKYKAEGFAMRKGLAESSVIARRHTTKVIEFNNAWWSEFCMHSVRDQLSFMYAADKVGLRINWITPAARLGHPYFDYKNHLTAQPEPKNQL
jgi:hypothetical protein